MKEALRHRAATYILLSVLGLSGLLGLSFLLPSSRAEVVLLPRMDILNGSLDGDEKYLDRRLATEMLVDAIIQVESCGNPLRVGSAGERGLMQIKAETWRETTLRMFGRALPFSRAFEPGLNRRVGKAYLAELQNMLCQSRTLWKGDERTLLLAAYNAGPTRIIQSGYDPRKVPRSTKSYVERVINLHELYLADDAPAIRRLLLAARIPDPATDS